MINEEGKDVIIQELLKEGKVKPGQTIDYEYFKEIYGPYRDIISDKNFAKILGITYDSFMRIKRVGTKAKVLNEKKELTSKEEKEVIIQELLKGEKIKPGQLINYEYLKKIHVPYSAKISEKNFAEILGITCGNYRTIKSQKKRKAKVLKERVKFVNEDEKEVIIQELLIKNKIKENQLIDYKKFKEIYKLYEDRVSEAEFAQILGIRYNILIDIKNKRTKSKNI